MKNKGFTLIGIMIIVAIIAVLSAMLDKSKKPEAINKYKMSNISSNIQTTEVKNDKRFYIEYEQDTITSHVLQNFDLFIMVDKDTGKRYIVIINANNVSITQY